MTDTTPDSPAAAPSAIPRVPWNGWAAAFYVAAVFYTSQVVGGLAILAYPLSKGWSDKRSIDWLNQSVPAQFFYVLLAEGLVVLALYLFLRRYKTGFSLIGLKRPRWSDLRLGLLAVIPYYVLYAVTVGIVSYLVSGFNAQQTQQIGFDGAQGVGPLLLVFVSLVLLPPIVEELMVRGFLYSSLRKVMSLGWAVFLTSLLFAAAHLPEGGDAGPLYVAAVDTFVLSLVLIYLREKSGSLWASITLHTIKNGVAFLLLFVVHVN